ncbi:MAG: hypothetical protein KBG83_04300, partial [Bacteroidetes bacterium]|nr:hypothetical protein [Bacteroidota bacterium]
MNKLFLSKSYILNILLVLFFCGFVVQAPDNPHIRIFLIGDSMVAEKPLVDNPEHGWGQMLPMFFTKNVTVYNYARNGRSTKSFITEGQWKIVHDQLKPGDYVFIQFGHNDAKKEDPCRYVPAKPDYKENLRKFIREAREKQAIPILLTPVTRYDFNKRGELIATHSEYPAAMKEVATEENVPLIDVFEKSKELVGGLGGEKSRPLYLAGVQNGQFRNWNKKKDHTHFTRIGAFQMAQIVVDGIKKIKLPLAKELVKLPTQPFVGAGKVVGLDYYFNNEWRPIKGKDSLERYHYIWEDTTNSGFSQLGRVIDWLGAELDTLQSPPTDSVLKHFSIYIIVDPDTPKETKEPNLISDTDIAVIKRWVEQGGRLVLLANDKGNCEFEHLNQLANEFGIHFNEDNNFMVKNDNYDMGRITKFPKHPTFKGVEHIFIKEVSSLKTQPPAKSLLTVNGITVMATALY